MEFIPLVILVISAALCFKKPGLLFGCALLAYQYESFYASEILGLGLNFALVGVTIFLVVLQRQIFRPTMTDWSILLFCAFYALTILYSRSPESGLYNAIRLFAFGAVYYYAARFYVSTPRYGDNFLKDVMISTSIAAVSFGGVAAYMATSFGWRGITLGEGSAVAFSQMVDIAAGLSLFYFLAADRSHAKRYRLFALALFCAILPIAILNATRGTVISIVLAVSAYMLIIAFTWQRRRILRLVSIAAFGGLFVFSAMHFADSRKAELVTAGILRLTTNISGGQVQMDESSLERIHLMKLAVEMFDDSPFLGEGVGSYTAKTGRNYPHNMVLELLAETGIVGTIFFLLILGRFAWMSLRLLVSRQDVTRVAMAVGLFMIVAAHHQVSFTLWMAKPMFFAMGTICALYTTRRFYPVKLLLKIPGYLPAAIYVRGT